MAIKQTFENLKIKFDQNTTIIKLRSLSENQKKVIFFSVLIISFFIIVFFQFQMTKNRLSHLKNSVKKIDTARIQGK